ncbi:histidine phosphatase family protein [Glycomyces sp. NPDC047369]
MRTLYVVTHPEAVHHVEGVVGGWHDSTLTARGAAAAQAIAAALRSQVPDGAEVGLWSSDLRRTAQTAEAIGAAFGIRPVLDRRLREKSFGEAEGRPQDWLHARRTAPPATGDRMGHTGGVPDLEPDSAVAQRIYAAMDDLVGRPCAHQIIVTHGYALTFVVAAWIRMPPASLGYAVFKAPSGSITVLAEDDFHRSRVLVRLGDTRHLDAIA